MFRLIGLLIASTLMSWAQQYTLYVQNAVSLGARVAPGSLAQLSVFPQAGGSAELPVLTPATTTVQLARTFASIKIPVLAQGPTPSSVIVYIPADTPAGTTQISLSAESLNVAATFTLVASGFGFNENAVQVARSTGPEISKLTNAVHPGEYISLWGTGLNNATDTQVLFGGIPATPSYAGPAPGMTGVDQINVQVPDQPDIPESCLAALQVKAGGVSSNLGTIAYSRSSNICNHPLGLSADEMSALDSGNTAYLGRLSLSSSIGPPPVISIGLPPPATFSSFVRTDAAQVDVRSYDAAGLRLIMAPIFAGSAMAGCGSTGSAFAGLLFQLNPLNLGDSLTLSSPKQWFTKGVTMTPPTNGFFSYAANLPSSDPVSDPDKVPASFFDPGNWSLSAPGSTEVRPFDAQFTLGPAIRITNLAALSTIDRSSDAVVNWDATGYSTDDVLTLSINSMGYGVACRALASTGSITIAHDLLAPFQPGGQQPSLQVYLRKQSDRQPRFSIVMANGTLVPGVVSYSSSELVPVSFR